MKRLSDDPAVRLADCRGESVTPAGEVEVMRVVTDKQCPIVRKNVGSALDLHAGPNCMHCEGTGFVVKYVDRAHVTRLQAENAGCQKSLGELWKQIDAYRKSLEKMEAERDALKAEVERMTNLHAAIQLQRDHHRAKADALQSDLTKARELLAQVQPCNDEYVAVPGGWFERRNTFLAHQSAPAAKGGA